MSRLASIALAARLQDRPDRGERPAPGAELVRLPGRYGGARPSRITTPSRRITGSEEINMPTLNDLIDGDAQRLDTGFTFTEGPLYHPDGFYYFVDVRESKFYRIKPGEKAELLRENTGEGNGTTFDPQGRLIQCEGGNRRVTRWPADGTFASSDVLMDRFDGKRLSRPNDVVCKSDGSVYFTGPGGTWVYAADGTHIGTIKTPEVPANLAFGGPDMKTLFFTAHTSVYSMRVKVAGLPGHPFKKG